MKTLEQIKNEYAKSKGYGSWENLMTEVKKYEIGIYINELLILVQKECLKNAQKQLSLEECGFDGIDYGITNENNIIK